MTSGRLRVNQLEDFHPASRVEWRRWLAAHHDTAQGVWFVAYKKKTGRQQVSYEAAVEEALCFGWIDSTAKPIDDERSRLLFTPRKPRSGWARSNKQRIERLIERGAMAEAGLRAVEAAKRDGSWMALDAVEDLRVPPDLAQALAANPRAEEGFTRAAPSARKQSLWWIASAKRAETRQRRIEETVRRAADGRTGT